MVILSTPPKDNENWQEKRVNGSPLVMVNDSKGYILHDLTDLNDQLTSQNDFSSTPEGILSKVVSPVISPTN